MTESGDAGVVITNKDIYDKVSDVEKSVLAMAPQAQTLIDHETRMPPPRWWRSSSSW
jgi:hypothetical protein